MPEKYLGYWEPYSRLLLGRGMDITPTTISYKLDPEFFDDLKPEELITEHIVEYKVLHIDDERVYMMFKERPTQAYIDRYISAESSREDNEYWQNQFNVREYYFVSFEIDDQSYKRWAMLRPNNFACFLTEKEWSLPIEQLWINYNDDDRCYKASGSNNWCRNCGLAKTIH